VRQLCGCHNVVIVDVFQCAAKEASLTHLQQQKEIEMTALILFFGLFLAIMAIGLLVSRNQRRRRERIEFIVNYPFPSGLRFKLDQAYPQLSHEQIKQVLEGLRAWFLLIAANPHAKLGMPSKAVDTAWHEFILLTKNYATFCDKAFGKFLHHTPHVGDLKAEQDGLARTWGLGSVALGGAALIGAAGLASATAMSGQHLFGLDRQLGLADGNLYTQHELDGLDKRYQQLQASGDVGGGESGSSSSSDGSGCSDGGSCGDGGGGGGGCGGGGCGS